MAKKIVLRYLLFLIYAALIYFPFVIPNFCTRDVAWFADSWMVHIQRRVPFRIVWLLAVKDDHQQMSIMRLGAPTLHYTSHLILSFNIIGNYWHPPKRFYFLFDKQQYMFKAMQITEIIKHRTALSFVIRAGSNSRVIDQSIERKLVANRSIVSAS